MKAIVTKRLLIRNFLEADAPDLFELLREPSADCFLSNKIESLGNATSTVVSRVEDDQMLAVCLRPSGPMIGELFCMQEVPDTFNVGWNFRPEYQGQGYATEAVRAFFSDLFDTRNARRLYAYVEEDNARSQKLCRRLGMRPEGRFLDFVSFRNYSDGSPMYVNTLQFALLAREWKGLTPP